MAKNSKLQTTEVLEMFQEVADILGFTNFDEIDKLMDMIFEIVDNNKQDKDLIMAILNKGLNFKEQLFVSYMIGGLKGSKGIVKLYDTIDMQKSHISLLRNKLADIIDDSILGI